MRSHKDLDVWKASISLAKKVYEATEDMPSREQFGIAAQLRKSAVSIGSNIAEGAARQGAREFVQFLYIALGSASELDTQLEIARQVKLVSPENVDMLASDLSTISRMLQGLIRSIKPGAGKRLPA